MKKLAIYVNSMNASGGIERVISNLLHAWEDKYEICLITKDDESSYYSIPPRVICRSLEQSVSLNMRNRVQRIAVQAKSLLMCVKRLRKELRDFSPDYIYSTTPLNALEICLAGTKFREKIVASEHGSYFGYNTLYTKLKRVLYPKLYCISVPNKMDAEIYKNWGCNVVYIPHIVTYHAHKKNSLDSKILLNVGRLTKDKQQDVLIESWYHVRNKAGWCLWIVGDGEEWKNLEKLIQAYNVADSVKLMPATKEIECIYEQANAFVLTSRFEGFGMVLLEAMSFGVPCIAFDCQSSPRDIIVDKKNGFLVTNNDREAMTNQLEWLVSMQDVELKAMGNHAFHTVADWDNEEILSRWDRIFK